MVCFHLRRQSIWLQLAWELLLLFSNKFLRNSSEQATLNDITTERALPNDSTTEAINTSLSSSKELVGY